MWIEVYNNSYVMPLLFAVEYFYPYPIKFVYFFQLSSIIYKSYAWFG